MDRYDPDLLLGYIENELGDEDRARFEQQMAEDDQLAALVRGLAGDRALLRSLPEADAPTGLVDDAMHRLERTMLLDASEQPNDVPIPLQRGREIAGQGHGSNWGRVVGITGLAAAVLIGAGLTWLAIYDDRLSQTARDLANQEQPPEQTDNNTGTSFSESLEDPSTARRERRTDRPLWPRTVDPRLDESAVVPPAALSEPEEAADDESNRLLDRVADATDHIHGEPDEPAPDPLGNPGSIGQPALPPEPTTNAPVIALADNGAVLANPAPQLLVITDSPEQTQQEIVAWCLTNGVPVVETEGLDFAYDYAEPSWIYNPPNQPVDQNNRLALLIESEQLGALVQDMNADAPVPDLEPYARQRAIVNRAPVTRQRAQIQGQPEVNPPAYDQPEAEPIGGNAQPAEGFAQLRAPNNLGNEEQTRHNYNNVLQFNNRVALDPQAQETAPLDSAPSADRLADIQPDHQDNPAEPDPAAEAGLDPVPAERGGEEAAQPAETPGLAQLERRQDIEPLEQAGRNDPREPSADAPQEGVGVEDVELRESQPVDIELPLVSAPRGNWLSPQLPLANHTPIWSNSPHTQIVPIVMRQAEPREMQRMLLEEAQNQIEPGGNQPLTDSDPQPDDAVEESEPGESEDQADSGAAPPTDQPVDP
ncbi:MAG: hypothetical protein AAGC44_00815 [Planctomycetota bacterium]